MSFSLRLLAVASLFLLPQVAPAQSLASAEAHCSLLPMDAAKRGAQAALVVEGEVLDARSFWDAQHQRIYTAHRVRVYSLLKGNAAPELTVLTEGGTVGTDRHELTNTLALQPGEQGVLFLTRAAFPGTEGEGEAWAAYASQQGFIRYELSTGTAAEPFRDYGRISARFYEEITATTGQARRVLQPNPVLAAAVERALAPPVAAKGQAPVIAALSPLTIPAGTGAVLTITGTGFGSARGSGFVEFRNADDGGATLVRPQDSEYVSWADTRIQVRVPSLGQPLSPAGSGPVRVTTNDQMTTTSLTAITVPYAISNVRTTSTNVLVRPNPINQNGRGGYGFRFEQSFTANAAASLAWRAALSTWRCQTGMNWDVEATPRTGRGATEDGENSVGFDQGSELPANVLGRTSSYYKGCFRPDGSLAFYVQEIDMQFDDATNWQFGPGPAVGTQLDFQTVSVHELGHAQQLAHVILPRAVMHYAVARGQTSRIISADDVAGGRLVLRTKGFVPQGCGPAPMLPAPLISFGAEPAAGGIRLNWATREECFLTGFEVQRAAGTDTTRWTTLSSLPLTGSGASTYSYLDAQAPAGLSYYRLRLRRPDNSLDAAPPVLATSDAAAASAPVLFPNPLSGGALRLQYPAAAVGRVSLVFYDAVGRRYRGGILDYQPGLNILLVPGSDALRPGLYFLRYRNTEGQEGYLRFVRTAE